MFSIPNVNLISTRAKLRMRGNTARISFPGSGVKFPFEFMCAETLANTRRGYKTNSAKVHRGVHTSVPAHMDL